MAFKEPYISTIIDEFSTDLGKSPHWKEVVVESQPSKNVLRMELLKLTMFSVLIVTRVVPFSLAMAV